MAHDGAGIPAFPSKLLRWICPSSIIEGIEGDLLEAFDEDLSMYGPKQARRKFWWGVLRFMRPGILLRHRVSINLIQTSMLRNYLIVAWRNLGRNKAYSFINIAGLTLGLSVSIVLLLIIRFEFGFDTYHKKTSRLYQIEGLDNFGEYGSHVPQGLIKTLKDEVPAVEETASVMAMSETGIRVDGVNLMQSNAFFMHPAFLQMIDVDWIVGSPSESLSKPYQVVLDEATAKRLFKGRDPIGQVIKFDNAFDITVSGIIKQVRAQSEFQMKMIMSYETLKKYEPSYNRENYWEGGDSGFHGYLLVREGADISSVERMATGFLSKHATTNPTYAGFKLVPLHRSHFDQDNDSFNYITPLWIINILTAIAALVMLIASINFINLATAQATVRAREIGVRKVLGSSRGAIITQFFIETLVMVTLSVVIAVGIASTLIPYTSYFFTSNIQIAEVWDLKIVAYLLCLIVFMTFLAGSYPALILSGFKPLSILRGGSSLLSSKRIQFRKVLVILQFSIAQVMVIFMLIGGKQIRFLQETDIGFNHKDVLTVAMPFRDSTLLQEQFKVQLLSNPAIKEVSFGLTSPAAGKNLWWGNTKNPKFLKEEESFRLQWVDQNYMDFYGIHLLAGRSFQPTDTGVVALVNEQAVRIMGLKQPEDIIGEKLTYWGSNTVHVIGVVQNYHSQGLAEEIPPHIFMSGNWNFQQAQIRIDSRNAQAAIAHIEKVWTTLHPDYFFNYAFLSDTINNFYASESKLSNFVGILATTGILIGCMGLFALVSFVAAKRSKEMSVRRVLGATVGNVMLLLTTDFLSMVLIAFAVAVPVGWYVMNLFLQQYANHVEMDWSVFALAGLATLGLAMITVVSRSLSTALVNPVEHLKQE